MSVIKEHILTVFLIIFVSVKECSTCFTYNETHSPALLKAGSSFYQECYCKEPKYTTKNLKWLDIHDQEIGPKGPGMEPKAYTEWGHRSLNLHIPSLSKSLSGSYKCVTQQGEHRNVIAYEVDAYEPLYFINTEETQYMINGRDSMITCEARSDTQPLISWHRDKDEFSEITSNAKYEIAAKGLIVKNVSPEDGGIYKCTASVLRTGEDVDRFIKVEIMTAPTIRELTATPESVVLIGEPLSLECSADGFPLPKYVWQKVTESGPSLDKNVTWLQEGNKIVFDNVTDDDRGVYECLAQNIAGEVKREITVEVLIPPTITEFENITTAEGNETKIKCKASGRPRPRINVVFQTDSEDDTRITYEEMKKSDIETEFNLYFKVNRSHGGLYLCNASNEIDIVAQEMYLNVLYKPYFDEPEQHVWAWDEKPVNLSCENHSQPPATVQWSYQGKNEIRTVDHNEEIQVLIALLQKMTDNIIPLKMIKKSLYGTYECTARNDLGEAKKVIIVKEAHKPPLVKNVDVVTLTTTSATFDIESPDFEGPPIIGFTAEYDEDEKYYTTSIHMNRTWAAGIPYKVNKLKPMTRYFFKFAAINEVGAGPFSDFVEFETPEKSIPEPLSWDYGSNSIIIPSDDKMLKLRAPEHNNDPIDYYIIKYCPVDEPESDSCFEDRIPPTTELKLTHLVENTTYILEMVAQNSMGNSTPSKIEVFILKISTPEEWFPLTAGGIIGVSIVVVVFSIILLDLLLFFTRRQGMIASCCYKKNKNDKEGSLQTRDKKGLLKDNGESAPVDTLKRPDNGHKEFEYNKSTGIITGKHSAV